MLHRVFGRTGRRVTFQKTLLGAVAAAAAVAAPAAWQGGAPAAVFTQEQADAGRATFAAQCAACHGRDLAGSDAPPLAGSGFFSAWKTQSTQYLFKYVQDMPPGGPYLRAEEYLGVIAYILQQNGASAGADALTAATDAPIGSVATGDRPAR
jgi:mono/diheme cytochrome c family protein